MKHPLVLIRAALLLVLSLAAAGCGLTGLRHRSDDNRQVRALQEASLSPYGERPVAGRSIDGFFRDGVGLITVKGASIPVGRAAPLSRDGYFLTAWHVVDQDGFLLSDSLPSASGQRVQIREYPGRVVWHDKAADLALVKFDFRPSWFFKTEGPPLVEGDPVFSAASGRNSGTRIIPWNQSGVYDLHTVLTGGIGNGAFRTAGKVTALKILPEDKGSRRLVCESTLIGRGGMSGAPVVNRHGQLAGIVTGARVRLFPGTRTTFSMLDSRTLETIIKADRRRP
ncbi:MAG: serine protease [Verrucomicrobiota bacterium]